MCEMVRWRDGKRFQTVVSREQRSSSTESVTSGWVGQDKAMRCDALIQAWSGTAGTAGTQSPKGGPRDGLVTAKSRAAATSRFCSGCWAQLGISAAGR